MGELLTDGSPFSAGKPSGITLVRCCVGVTHIAKQVRLVKVGARSVDSVHSLPTKRRNPAATHLHRTWEVTTFRPSRIPSSLINFGEATRAVHCQTEAGRGAQD